MVCNKKYSGRFDTTPGIMEEKKMAFKLDSVVPWGRNMEEYKLMFRLDDNDMSKKLQGLAMVQPVLIMR